LNLIGTVTAGLGFTWIKVTLTYVYNSLGIDFGVRQKLYTGSYSISIYVNKIASHLPFSQNYAIVPFADYILIVVSAVGY
jgi:hypothetical protein